MARRRYQKGCLFKRGKNWVLRYREDVLGPEGGLSRAHRSVALGHFETKKEARRVADNYLLPFNSETRRPQAAITFEDFWRRHFELEIMPALKFSTQRAYHYLAESHLLRFFGMHRLGEISRLDIQHYIGEKLRQGYAPKTLAHLRNLLSRIFEVAISWGWMNDNPARGVKLPPMVLRRQGRVLTREEIASLSQGLDEPARTIFLTGILTGLRIGEILGLCVEDVDLSRGVVSVYRNVDKGHVQNTPKTKGSERRIPLASRVLQAIQQWLEGRSNDSSWLFASLRGTPLNDRNLLRRQIWPVCSRLGIARFGWHSLRHSFSTYNGNSGVAMPVLQSLLGHTHPETTMIYTHPLLEVQRQAVENLASDLFPNVPNSETTECKGSSLIH